MSHHYHNCSDCCLATNITANNKQTYTHTHTHTQTFTLDQRASIDQITCIQLHSLKDFMNPNKSEHMLGLGSDIRGTLLLIIINVAYTETKPETDGP